MRGAAQQKKAASRAASQPRERADRVDPQAGLPAQAGWRLQRVATSRVLPTDRIAKSTPGHEAAFRCVSFITPSALLSRTLMIPADAGMAGPNLGRAARPFLSSILVTPWWLMELENSCGK